MPSMQKPRDASSPHPSRALGRDGLMLTARYEAVVETEFHTFGLMPDDPRDIVNGQYPEFSLAIFAEDVIFVRVGVKSGPVEVAVEMHDRPVEYDDANWEDAVEGDLNYDLPEGVSVFQSLNYAWFPAIPKDGTLTPPGRHRYRVRIYAQGRNRYYDGAVFDNPVENYLLQLWPTVEEEAPRQLKNLSGV